MQQKPKPRIGFFVRELTTVANTMACFVIWGGNAEAVIASVKPLSAPYDGSEHHYAIKDIENLGGVTLRNSTDPADEMDLLLVELSQSTSIKSQDLDRWTKSARQIGCISSHYDRLTFRSAVRELVRSFPYYLRAKVMGFLTTQSMFMPYVLPRRRFYYAPNVHYHFLTDPKLTALINSQQWEAGSQRSIRLGFLGNRAPVEREAVLRRIGTFLKQYAEVKFFSSFPISSECLLVDNVVLWVEYGFATSSNSSVVGVAGVTRGLEPDVYLAALQQMDFCLCPFGWGGMWTHRFIESMMMGAIPIGEDVERYQVGLVDMEHCIEVHHGDWEEAIRRALTLDAASRVRMRRNLLKLRHEKLAFDVAALKFRREIGLNG